MLVMITNEDEVVFLLQYKIRVRNLEKNEHKTKPTRVSHIWDKNALHLKSQRVSSNVNAMTYLAIGFQMLGVINKTEK